MLAASKAWHITGPWIVFKDLPLVYNWQQPLLMPILVPTVLVIIKFIQASTHSLQQIVKIVLLDKVLLLLKLMEISLT